MSYIASASHAAMPHWRNFGAPRLKKGKSKSTWEQEGEGQEFK